MQCEYYALEGLAALLNTVEQVKNTVTPACISKGYCEPCMMGVIDYVLMYQNNY